MSRVYPNCLYQWEITMITAFVSYLQDKLKAEKINFQSRKKVEDYRVPDVSVISRTVTFK